MGVIGGEEGQKEAESLFKEIMTEPGSDTSRYIKFIGYADSTPKRTFVKIHITYYNKNFKDKKIKIWNE